MIKTSIFNPLWGCEYRRCKEHKTRNEQPQRVQLHDKLPRYCAFDCSPYASPVTQANLGA